MPTISQYTQMILATERQVRTWKRRRQAMILSAKAKQQHRDPAFAKKFCAGKSLWDTDPLLKAWRIEKGRRTHLAKDTALPASFTPAVRSKMYRMRRCGVSREDAIAALLKPSAGVGA